MGTRDDIAELPVLQMPLMDETWMEQGACRGLATRDFDPWHPDNHDHGLARWARRVCVERCPVRQECIGFALRVRAADPEGVHGMFGGYRPDELEDLEGQHG